MRTVLRPDLVRSLRCRWAKAVSRGDPAFTCPICAYQGPFLTVRAWTGRRRHAQCPACLSKERHRLQHLVIDRLTARHALRPSAMLHVAPEPFFVPRFRRLFRRYVSTDRSGKQVAVRADLRTLPFAGESFDLVFASHVLEHIGDDRAAIREIRRVVRPGGIAVLPVPVLGATTVEYPRPNAFESHHVRSPGLDYFDRYAEYFRSVERFTPDDFPDCHQTRNYEEPPPWPVRRLLPRRPSSRERRLEVVPVCTA